MSGFKLEPGDIVDVEPVEESDFCEHLKAIESHELVDLLVEDFFVLSSDKFGRENLRYELSEEVSHLAIRRFA